MGKRTDEEQMTKQARETLGNVIEERFDDDDGIWRLAEDDIQTIVKIADGFEWDNGQEPNRDAVLIEMTALVLQQRILYRDEKGPGSQ